MSYVILRKYEHQCRVRTFLSQFPNRNFYLFKPQKDVTNFGNIAENFFIWMNNLSNDFESERLMADFYEFLKSVWTLWRSLFSQLLRDEFQMNVAYCVVRFPDYSQ